MRAFREELSNTFGTQSRRRSRSASVEVRHIQGVRMELSQPHASEGDAHSEGTWIFSFADLIMNLLMFFVMMFAISNVDKGKMQDIQQAFSSFQEKTPESKTKIKRGSGNESSYAASTGVASKGKSLSNSEILDNVKDLLSQLDSKKLQNNEKQKALMAKISPSLEKLSQTVLTEVKIDPFSQGFEIAISEDRLFLPFDGKDLQRKISPSGSELLTKIAKELNAIPSNLSVMVYGFGIPKGKNESAITKVETNQKKKSLNPKDNLKTQAEPSQFLISVSMANSVREKLLEKGMKTKNHQFQVSGFGEFDSEVQKKLGQNLLKKSKVLLKIAILKPEEAQK